MFPIIRIYRLTTARSRFSFCSVPWRRCPRLQRQPVEIRRVDLAFGVVADDVAIVHFISKHQNDIGGGCSRSRSQAGYQKGAVCKFGFSKH